MPITTSFSPACATRTTGVPAATTWPTSASIAGHHAIDIRYQSRIAGLVGLVAVSRQRPASSLALRRLECGFLGVEHRLADEILVAQILVALQFGTAPDRQVAAAACRPALACACGNCRSCGSSCISTWPALDPGADVDLARNDLAADPKSEPRFDPRRALRPENSATKSTVSAASTHGAHRADFLDFFHRPGTGGQQQRHSSAARTA